MSNFLKFSWFQRSWVEVPNKTKNTNSGFGYWFFNMVRMGPLVLNKMQTILAFSKNIFLFSCCAFYRKTIKEYTFQDIRRKHYFARVGILFEIYIVHIIFTTSGKLTVIDMCIYFKCMQRKMAIHVMKLCVNRTTGMPKSVLRYSLDKGQYFHPLLLPNNILLQVRIPF